MKPFVFTVTVEAEHMSGKFASRDDIAVELAEAIEQADPGCISVDEAEYETSSWEVS